MICIDLGQSDPGRRDAEMVLSSVSTGKRIPRFSFTLPERQFIATLSLTNVLLDTAVSELKHGAGSKPARLLIAACPQWRPYPPTT